MAGGGIDQQNTGKFVAVITKEDPRDLAVRKRAWQIYLDGDGLGTREPLDERDRDILRVAGVEHGIVPWSRLLGYVVSTRVDMAAGALLHRLDPELLKDEKAVEFIHQMFLDLQPR